MSFGQYKALIFMCTLICLTAGAYVFFVRPHESVYNEMRRQTASIEKKLLAAKMERSRLKNLVYDLEHSALAVEKVAREKFKLCRENERFYRF